MTYGPSTGTKVTYTYDAQERVKSVKYSDTNTTYGYNYSADGSLAGITVNGIIKIILEVTSYEKNI